MNRIPRIGAVMTAVALVVALGTAPSASAKGRPMHATFARSSCLTFTVSATWWKRLDVHGVKVELFAPLDTFIGGVGWSSETGFASPFTRTYEGNGGASTMYAVVSLYADSDIFSGAPPLASTTTEAVTAACG
jgi:hypothetical protein